MKRQIRNLKDIFQNLKLSTRIYVTFIVVFLPIAILVGIWFAYVTQYNSEYEGLIANSSAISDFSLDFKKNFDYKIYLMVVGNKSVSEASPLDDIDAAERVLNSIDLTQESKQNIRLIAQNQKYLTKLRVYTKVLADNIAIGGRYDENTTIWDQDVMIVTSLIQENIMVILHNETKAIADLRQTMDHASWRMLVVSAILIGFIVIYGLGMVFVVSRTITRPIYYLQNLTDRVAQGNLEVRSELRTGAEVKKLSDSLNIMIDRISSLIEEVKMEQINLREAELEVLQMQINPHFLYNTLDTIVWLADADDSLAVVKMVESLSEFFRSSLNQGNDITIVKEEIVHISSYLEIQQVRYQDILSYEITIPEELQEFTIPKITLQPLIENALYHGIKNKRGMGLIKIAGYQNENEIVLTVNDNGIGMTRERLHQIRDGLSNGMEKKDFYGLYNVNERLRLKFGEQYHLEFFSVYGEGTTVEVHLPKWKLEDLPDYQAGEVLRQVIHERHAGD